MVNKITTQELRQGKINGGIIFQGCAEPHDDWVNGVNDMLTEEGILLEGTKYKPEDVYSFEHEGITNLVFPFEPVKLDIGKLAMWRLATHGTFSAKWVEDYVDNRLGGPLRNDEPEQKKKPDCALIGQDGNIFNLMGIASRTLRKHGIDRITIEYSRVTKYDKPKELSDNEYDYITWDYSEKLTIDRETETIEYFRKIGSECDTTWKYHVGGGVEQLLDETDADMFEDIEGNPSDAIDNPKESKTYTITIDFAHLPSKTITGSFDRRGLPTEWASFANDLREFLLFYGEGIL